MKNIKSKCLLFVSILIGLLLFAACDAMQLGNSDARSARADTHALLEKESSSDSGYEWISVFNEDGTMEDIRVPAAKYEVTEAEKAKNAKEAAEVEFFTIIDGKLVSGKNVTRSVGANNVMRGSDSMGMLFIGDGFTSAQVELFGDNALETYDYLTSSYPINLYRHDIVVMISAYYSAQSGVSRETDKNGPIINNYFGSTFYFDGKTDRLLYVTRSDRVEAARDYFRQVHGFYPDATIILANSTKYGGGGGAYAAISLHSDKAPIAMHELGHSFGGLADEYFWRGREAPNMTSTSNPATVKWSSWVGFDGIGVYPYTDNDDQATDPWFRPHQNCLMRYLYQDFCAVCSTELIRIMTNKSGKEAFLYSVITGGVRITGISEPHPLVPMGGINIPSRIGTRAVIEIGASAF
jgi:hypothetical protein